MTSALASAASLSSGLEAQLNDAIDAQLAAKKITTVPQLAQALGISEIAAVPFLRTHRSISACLWIVERLGLPVSIEVELLA